MSDAGSRRLLGATALMASGTMISRVLGFVRTMLVAFALGNATAQGDTFMLATVVPNSLYMIFAGGALNTVLVPQVVRHIHADADEGEAFINRVITAFGLALLALTALCLAFTPQVMGLWMGDAWSSPRLAPHRESLFFLAYLTMPQLFFYGAFFLIGQVLNARDRFGPMMWAPIVNNLVQIAVLGSYAALWATSADRTAPFTREQALVLGVGSTVGIVAQTLALVPFVRALGLRYRPRFDLRGQGLGATFRLAQWAIGYVLLTQFASIVVTRLASTATIVDPAKPGPGVLAYNEAYLTWILPHSLLTVSLATALLPAASRMAAAGDLAGVAHETTRALRLANTFIIPVSLGFVTMAMPFAALVFGNGAGADDWHAVGLTLMGFAVGLAPYTMQYLALRAYYALEELRAAFWLQVPISAANALLALAWVKLDPDPLTVAPRLALCYSASYVLGAVWTHRALARRLDGLDLRPTLRHAARVLVAATPGAAVAYAIVRATTSTRLTMAGGFLAAGVVLCLTYVGLARLLRVDEVVEITTLLGRRLRRPRGAAAATEAPADLPAAPAVLDGRYRLTERWATRARAQTWLATDETLGRTVRVHLLDPDAPRVGQALDAARAAATLTDARFARVLDVSAAEADGHGPYVVCEHAEGPTLAQALDVGELTAEQADDIRRATRDAVATVHHRGQALGRLAPERITLTRRGPKVTLFDLADALDPIAAPTRDADRAALNTVVASLSFPDDPEATVAYTPEPDHESDEPTGPLHPATPTEADPVAKPADEPPPPGSATTSPVEAMTPHAGRPAPTQPRRWGMTMLFGLFLVCFVGGLVGVFLDTYSQTRTAAPTAVKIASASIFDPKADGGDTHENDAQAPLAIDGKADTAWTTERYGKTAAFNDRKPGVGLIIDLGHEQTVKTVTVTTTGATSLQVRVPTTAGSASTNREADWRTVASATDASGAVVLTLGEPAKTRYLLVYLTKLPAAAGASGYQGRVAEVAVAA